MEEKVTLLNKIERFGGLLVLLLLLARILIGTELGVILRTALTLLAIFYMWFGFFIFNRAAIMDLADYKKRARFSPFKIASSIVMGISYSFCLIALVFSLLFLKGMHLMLGFSTLLLAAGTCGILIYNLINKQENSYLRQFYLRSAILGVIALGLMFASVETRLKVLYKDHPDFVEAYMEYYNNPEETQAIDNLREVRSRFR